MLLCFYVYYYHYYYYYYYYCCCYCYYLVDAADRESKREVQWWVGKMKAKTKCCVELFGKLREA